MMSRIPTADNFGRPSASSGGLSPAWWVVNLLTLAVAGVGVWGGLMAWHRGPETLLLFLVLAGLVDAVDGPLARLWGVASAFGRGADLLADLTAFVVVPLVVAVGLGLMPLWAGLLLLVAGCLRGCLVVCAASLDDCGGVHIGLPYPAAGLLLAGGLVGPGLLLVALFVGIGMLVPVRLRRVARLGVADLLIVFGATSLAWLLAAQHPWHLGVLVGVGLYVVVGAIPRRTRV